MFIIESSRFNYYKSPEDKEELDKAIPLIKEVFGYTDEEIEKFKQKLFFPPLAIDITLEQAKLAMQPFCDAHINIYVDEYDDNHILINSGMYRSKLDLIEQPPQKHYYDEPVIRRDQLVDPYNPPTWNSAWTTGFTFINEPQQSKPTITCPYCKSTNVSKIGALSRAVSVGFWGLASGKIGKTHKCNSCGSTW